MRTAGLISVGRVAAVVAITMVVFIVGCAGEEFADDVGVQAPSAPGDAGAAATDMDAVRSIGEGETGESDALVGGAGESAGLPLPQLVDRKIIRTARLELEVENVSAAVAEVEDVAVAAGGFVSASNVFIDAPSDSDGGDGEAPRRTETATVTIRVPAEAYRSVVSQLRGVAEEVKSESSEASEVTEEYTDLQARLRNQEATEAQLLELLTRAETIPDILTVQDRISQVRLEIEQVQGRINVLDNLTDLATITVQLAAFVPPGEETGGEQGWAAEAWDVAWEGSQTAAVVLGTVAIVGGVVLLWLAVPALVIAIAWRRFGWRLSKPSQPPSQEPGGTGTPA
jgi:hypothetical protein